MLSVVTLMWVKLKKRNSEVAGDAKKKDKRGKGEENPGYLILAQMGLNVSSADPILLIVSEMFSMSRVHKAKRPQ